MMEDTTLKAYEIPYEVFLDCADLICQAGIQAQIVKVDCHTGLVGISFSYQPEAPEHKQALTEVEAIIAAFTAYVPDRYHSSTEIIHFSS